MFRRVLYALVVGLAIFFVIRHYDELKLVLQTLAEGEVRWLVLALGVQAIWLVVLSANLLACYNLVGVHEQLSRVFFLTTSAVFMSVIAPSLGAGTLAVLLGDAQQRDKAIGRVSTASFLYVMFDYVGLLVVMTIGMIILYNHQLLSGFILGGASFIFVVGLSLIATAILGIRSALHLKRLLGWLVRHVNQVSHRLIHKEIIKSEKAARFAGDISEGLTEIRRAPLGLVAPFFLALTRKSLMLLILYSVSLAFDAPFDLPTLLVSFMVSYLFTIASVTPSGVGFVEGAMALTQTGMGVNPVDSAVIIIAYRGLTFWLVAIYGFIAFRYIGLYRRNAQEQAGGESPRARIGKLR